MPWVFDPQSGGVKVPPRVQEETRKRILDYAEKHYVGKYTRLTVRFRGALCCIDAFCEPVVPRGWRPPKELGSRARSASRRFPPSGRPPRRKKRDLAGHDPLREANSSRLPSSTMPASRSSALMPCRPSAALRL